MPLIPLSNNPSDYAEMLGTTPRKRSHTPLRPSSLRRSWLVDNAQSINCESGPQSPRSSTLEVKAILYHLHSDPNSDVMNLFKYLLPVWIIGCVMGLVSWLSQQQRTRLLEQKAASALGDAPVSDVEWGSTVKMFLWAVFGGLLVIFLIMAIFAHWIDSLVKEHPDRSWNNSEAKTSETRANGARELKGADVYSGIFWTT